MALIILTDKIMSAINNGEYVVGAFLDLSKAFDTVNHAILFKKLDNYGIRGIAYEWFKSYLNLGSSMYTLIILALLIDIFIVEFPKGQFWDLCYFLFILMTCPVYHPFYILYYLRMIQICS